MAVHKILKTMSLLSLMSVSQTAVATEYAFDKSNLYPHVQNVGWDMESLKSQTQGAVYLRAEIERA